MNPHESTLVAFLSGDLDPMGTREFDEHLLGCEDCWRALREDRAARSALERQRDPAPSGLADRIRLAVELEASHLPKSRTRRRARVGSLVGVVLALAGTALWLSVGLPNRSTAVGTVVQFAQMIPPPSRLAQRQAASTAVGAGLALTVDGQHLRVDYYRYDGTEVVVATSDHVFGLPAGGRPLHGIAGMAWVAREGDVTLYCVNGRQSVLFAGRMSYLRLAGLARGLHVA